MIYNREEIEENYRDLFEHSLDLIYVSDLNGNFLDANDLTLISLGYEREEMSNIKFLDLLEPDESKIAYTDLKEIIKTGKQSKRREYKIKVKNGNFIFLEAFAVPLKKNGKIYAILGFGKNVTYHKKAEQKLIDSEEMFRALYKEGPIATYTWKKLNDDFVFIEFNNMAEKITNGNVVSFLGHRASNMYKDRPDILNDLHNCSNRKINITREMKYKFQFTGEEKYLLVKYGYVRPDLVIVQTEDITDIRVAEEKLRESELKYRYLYENTPFSIVLINSKGEIVDCNPRTETLFGYKKTDLLGKLFHKISVIHPDYLPIIVDLFKKFIKGEKVHRIDLMIYKKDGSLLWVNLQASLVQLENNYFVQALFTDISKRKEAEFLINEEIVKLKELDQIRKNLISRVAHELKTPLASICGGAEFLTSVYNNQIGKEELEILNLIDKGGNRLKYLVDNLIDISRIEYDKFKLKKQMNDLCEIIKESSIEMNHIIKERELNLNLNLPYKLYLNIDRVRIEQVIMNLLSNAIKNTPQKGTITVKAETQENWAILSVSDTGVGLTGEEMEILFTRFGKIERYGEGLEYIDIQGSGLGLFISKEIVDLHGGNIGAESEGRHKGSKFIVKLPID
ncbi:MAG: PAS domain S-box protein [Promethearchaeota archaeon]|nr:MAG: PAS domain S-box protein [Candidatus Lokiarchaeota archaeon]